MLQLACPCENHSPSRCGRPDARKVLHNKLILWSKPWRWFYRYLATDTSLPVRAQELSGQGGGAGFVVAARLILLPSCSQQLVLRTLSLRLCSPQLSKEQGARYTSSSLHWLAPHHLNICCSGGGVACFSGSELLGRAIHRYLTAYNHCIITVFGNL